MQRFLLRLLLGSLLSTPLFLYQGCSTNPCADEWYIKCTCCTTDDQKESCHKKMDVHVKDLRLYMPEADLKACQKKVDTFKCENEPPVNLQDYCGS